MRMRIDREKIILVLFVASIFHNILLLFFLTYLCWASLHSTDNCIKSLFLIALRTILGSHVAVPISSYQMIKWGLIFVIATIILVRCNHQKVNKKKWNNLWAISCTVGLFGAFVFLISSPISSPNTTKTVPTTEINP